MLYITTKDKHNTNTAYKTLLTDRAADGGLYLPFRMVTLERQQVLALGEVSFGQRVAQVLNIFFSANLSGWDVEFCIGRNPVRTVDMSQRILSAQTWHNQAWDYTWAESALAGKLCADTETPAAWTKIAIRVAFLAGNFGELLGQGSVDMDHPVDVAVPAGDFSVPLSVWYARKLGLPIANILCGCMEGSPVWDLLHLGSVKTDGSMPVFLEQLICEVLGHSEAARYMEICEKGGVYSLLPVDSARLRNGMFAGVISTNRVADLIPSVYRTNSHIMGPITALAYGGLLDFRAKTGENRVALLLSERSPVCDSGYVARAMGITQEELKGMLQ